MRGACGTAAARPRTPPRTGPCPARGRGGRRLRSEGATGGAGPFRAGCGRAAKPLTRRQCAQGGAAAGMRLPRRSARPSSTSWRSGCAWRRLPLRFASGAGAGGPRRFLIRSGGRRWPGAACTKPCRTASTASAVPRTRVAPAPPMPGPEEEEGWAPRPEPCGPGQTAGLPGVRIAPGADGPPLLAGIPAGTPPRQPGAKDPDRGSPDEPRPPSGRCVTSRRLHADRPAAAPPGADGPERAGAPRRPGQLRRARRPSGPRRGKRAGGSGPGCAPPVKASDAVHAQGVVVPGRRAGGVLAAGRRRG